MKNKKTVFILISLFFVFMFLRFYNIEERIIFDWDQEQFSYQIKNIVENKDFTLLGPRANNDRGFFLGPYFTYLLVPFYMFRNLHPIALIDFKNEYPIFGGINFLRVRKNGKGICIVESYINFDGWRNADEIAGELLENKVEIEIANHFSQDEQVRRRLAHLFNGNYPFSDCSECGAAAFVVAKYFNEKDRVKSSLRAYGLEDQIEDLYQHLRRRCA